jgi:lysozyme
MSLKSVKPGAILTPGYDVSDYQSVTIHTQQANLGKKFCYIKITEGVTLVQKFWQQHRTAAWAAGMVVGLYHFFHPKDDPHQQAAFFLKTAGSLTGMLPPALDYEETDGLAIGNATVAAGAFLGDMPAVNVVYLFSDFWPTYSGPIRNSLLWIADPNHSEAPMVPDPWDNFTFWQNSDSGGALDLDWFNGDLAALRALAGLPPT